MFMKELWISAHYIQRKTLPLVQVSLSIGALDNDFDVVD
jgi:hypothetical protein